MREEPFHNFAREPGAMGGFQLGAAATAGFDERSAVNSVKIRVAYKWSGKALEYVRVATRLQYISQPATFLDVTQAALAYAIFRLEPQLGVQLVQASGRLNAPSASIR